MKPKSASKLKALGRRLGRRAVAILVVMMAFGAVSTVAMLVPQSEDNKPATPPRPVPVQSQVVRLIPTYDDTFEVKGTVEPARTVDVRAELAEQVETIGPRDPAAPDGPRLVKGDSVRQGQVLVTLQRDRREAEVARAAAQVDYDRRELERMQALARDGAASPQDVSDAETRLKISQATLKSAQADLNRTVITAPIAGTVNWLIEKGEQAMPNTLIATIVDNSETKVVVDLSERDVGYFEEGSLHQVTEWPSQREGQPESIPARITFLSRTAEGSARTTRAELTVEAHRELVRNGQIVTVRLKRRDLHDVVFIPLRAIIPGDEREHVVHVADQGHAQKRMVEINLRMIRQGDQVQVVRGLVPGDRLIVEGTREVSDGQLIRERHVTLAEAPLAEFNLVRDDRQSVDVELARELAQRVGEVDGVLSAEVPEAGHVEIPITIDPELLKLAGLTGPEFLRLIDGGRVSPVRDQKGRDEPIRLRILAEATDTREEILEKVLVTRPDNRPIYVRQLVANLDYAQPTPPNLNALEVTARLDGADEALLQERVAAPLRQAIEDLASLEQIEQTFDKGVVTLRLTFARTADLQQMAVETAKRIGAASAALPRALATPTVRKARPEPLRKVIVRGDIHADRSRLMNEIEKVKSQFVKAHAQPDKPAVRVVQVSPGSDARALASQGLVPPDIR